MEKANHHIYPLHQAINMQLGNDDYILTFLIGISKHLTQTTDTIIFLSDILKVTISFKTSSCTRLFLPLDSAYFKTVYIYENSLGEIYSIFNHFFFRI